MAKQRPIRNSDLNKAEMTAEQREASDAKRLNRLMELLAQTPGIEAAEALLRKASRYPRVAP